jgi:hypothetical protein
LFEDGFDVFDDFLCEHVRIGQVVGFLEALASDEKVI